MPIFNNVLAGAAGQAGGAPAGYTIERSLRFNSADSAYLNRTPSSAGNRKTWTWAGWVKFSDISAQQTIFSAAADSSNRVWLRLNGSSLEFQLEEANVQTNLTTSAVYRDPSAWYHIVIAVDTTQSTSSNRSKLYVNGEQVTSFSAEQYPAQNYDTYVNAANVHRIGSVSWTLDVFADSYMADVHFIDGQALTASDFGESDTNGVWQPIEYTGTYGTNGFKLDFSDNSSAAALGDDSSGNNNDWTVNNISVAAGAGNDSLFDYPTNGTQTDTGLGGQVSGNYATLNPLNIHSSASDTLSNGNLECSMVSGSAGLQPSTIAFSSGKWYYETVYSDNGSNGVVGIRRADSRNFSNSYLYHGNGNKYTNAGSATAYGATYTNGDLIGVAVDMDAGTLTFYKNGTTQGQAFTGISGTYTFLQGMFSGTTGAYTVNFGQRAFAYSAPSGYKALCTTNLPDPTIADGSDYMDVVTYLGDGNVSRTISSLDFAPDLVWLKSRNNTGGDFSHRLFDTARGIDLGLSSNSTNAEENRYTATCGGVHAFTSNGFTLSQSSGNVPCHNASNNSMVAWTWDAGTSTVSNTDGSITSQVRANPSAGFSIVTWTGNGSNNQSVGHGLGISPDIVIIKCRSTATSWHTYVRALDSTGRYQLYLNSTSGSVDFGAPFFSPTSSLINLIGGTSVGINGSGSTYVAYCFAPVEGYSAFGSYTGNGSSDGPFVFTGHRSRWLMIKRTDSTGNWVMLDTARNSYNPAEKSIYADVADAEYTPGQDWADILSNGFKPRATYGEVNASGGTYVFASFAENPFKTARAR